MSEELNICLFLKKIKDYEISLFNCIIKDVYINLSSNDDYKYLSKELGIGINCLVDFLIEFNKLIFNYESNIGCELKNISRMYCIKDIDDYFEINTRIGMNDLNDLFSLQDCEHWSESSKLLLEYFYDISIR